ncbi:BSP-domain-containing protein [Ophiobolus disseminans]|uniref:BSP-domain-containing protein n=1 Tax=Ophiobolus disseminans TaxID=1469910 RepID=A0A6A6ZK30_9PLEO|nr:BSP-domain-containing protein [Ophiobolus disseminans]
MSSASASNDALPPPQSSALPPSHGTPNANSRDTPDCSPSELPSSDTSKVLPQRKPLLRLELRDLSSDGSRAFLRLIHASHALQDAVDAVLRYLYKDMHASSIPPTRSITLVIRDLEGVAYTTGLELDDDHKEIHFSTQHIMRIPESQQKEETLGVIVHEMVHCWQHSGFGTAPVGLTEGVADWVRLKAGYAPPHWKQHTDCDWDAGYERTGYFLEYLEKEHGADVVRRINDAMRGCNYDADKVWKGCCGKGVEELWKEYKKSVDTAKSEVSGQEKSDDKTEETSEGEAEEKSEDKTQEEDKDASEVQQLPLYEEDKTPREKARRGGNMHVPIRPGASS